MKNPGEMAGALETATGLKITRPSLFVQALTHPSAGAKNNQRLEFLGDAVLDLVVSGELFSRHPELPEGALHRLRARAVCEPVLAAVACRLGLGELLILGKGEESSGGRTRPSNLAACFEALVAAVYLDAGLEAARGFVLRSLDENLLGAAGDEIPVDAKSRLQELVQKMSPEEQPWYRLVREWGPDHDRRYLVGVEVGGREMGRGVGRSKKEAEQAAAAEALKRLRKSGG